MTIQIKNKAWQVLFPIAVLIAIASIACTVYLDYYKSTPLQDSAHSYQIHRKYGNPQYRYLNERDSTFYSLADNVLIYDFIFIVIGTIAVVVYERRKKTAQK